MCGHLILPQVMSEHTPSNSTKPASSSTKPPFSSIELPSPSKPISSKKHSVRTIQNDLTKEESSHRKGSRQGTPGWHFQVDCKGGHHNTMGQNGALKETLDSEAPSKHHDTPRLDNTPQNPPIQDHHHLLNKRFFGILRFFFTFLVFFFQFTAC